MTTNLAIGYLAGPLRHPPGARVPAGFATPTGRDPLSSRPAIPQAVITWTDAEAALPVGAGAPAAAIAGAPAFTVLCDRARRRARARLPSLDALLFSVLGATLAGLVAAVVFHTGATGNAWESYESVAASPSLRGSVEVGELRLIDSTRVDAPRSMLAAKATGRTTAN